MKAPWSAQPCLTCAAKDETLMILKDELAFQKQQVVALLKREGLPVEPQKVPRPIEPQAGVHRASPGRRLTPWSHSLASDGHLDLERARRRAEEESGVERERAATPAGHDEGFMRE